jgi:hypothetical protein
MISYEAFFVMNVLYLGMQIFFSPSLGFAFT